MIATYLSRQQALDADPKVIQQITFTANLERQGNTTMFFVIEEAKYHQMLLVILMMRIIFHINCY